MAYSFIAQAQPATPAAAPAATPAPEAPAATPAVEGKVDQIQAVTSQDGSAKPPVVKEQPPFWANPMFGLLIAFLVMMWFMSKSKKNEEKKRVNMLDQLKKGDRIQTIGGIRGSVVEAREDEVIVKVDEASNTKIHFSRSAIHKVLEEEKKSV